MNASKRRSTGVGIVVAAVLIATAFQIFGHGLIIVTELHPKTPPELAAKGVDMAGGQQLDYCRIISLVVIGITGLFIALLPNHGNKHTAR
jgi:hypothetical protein